MTSYTDHQGCDGTPEGNERRVGDMGYSLREQTFLDLMRLYLLTFTDPTSHGWMKAGSLAASYFGPSLGPQVAHEFLSAVNAVRLIRSSPLEFSNPGCPGCAKVLCEAERQFMGALKAVFAGQRSAAYANAMLLCEGDDASDFLAALENVRALVHGSADAAPVGQTSKPASDCAGY